MPMGCHLTKIYVGGINSAETCERSTRRHGPLPKRLWPDSPGPNGGLSLNASVYVQGTTGRLMSSPS